jgi:membrane-bound lytic murein transglycosylase MltF
MGNDKIKLVAAATVILAGCGAERTEVTSSVPASEPPPAATVDLESSVPDLPFEPVSEPHSEPIPEAAVLEEPAPTAADFLIDPRRDPWFGDFEGMVERRVIRALVTYSRTHYFLDGAEPRGLSYEALKRFETVVNEQLGTGHLKVHVVAIPVKRDDIFTALTEGIGDLATANLLVTEERNATVDFSPPFFDGVAEFVATDRQRSAFESFTDLSNTEIHVRRSSTYHDSLLRMNDRLQSIGLSPISIMTVDEALEDEDLLEMVNAGLVPAVVTDSVKAALWEQALPEIQIHDNVPLRTLGRVAWAYRKDSPQLQAVLDDFVRNHRRGTLLGNMALQYYLEDASYIGKALDDQDVSRFNASAEYFRRFADEYELDWLFLIAQGYQESRLDPNARSNAGALGIMQVLPSTASDRNVGIEQIETMENNIHAGAKYMRFLLDRYFSDDTMDPMNQYLFAFAAYNAGPRRVAQMRRTAEEQGLDPNVWFDNVETIAAQRIGRETVQYVSNIFKYYVTYRRLTDLGRLTPPDLSTL